MLDTYIYIYICMYTYRFACIDIDIDMYRSRYELWITVLWAHWQRRRRPTNDRNEVSLWMSATFQRTSGMLDTTTGTLRLHI